MSVRVALIGYGLGGSVFHAPLIAATPGLELAAVVTRDPARRAALENDFPAARAFGDADTLFADARNFDLVVIASPNATHELLARRALDAGLNVVIDKPFAATASGAQALIDRATARRLLVIPFQNRRWDGDFLTVRRLVADGPLGEILHFESRMERWRPIAKPRWTTATAAAEVEGIIYDLGSHLVDQALVLFGPAARVYAEADARGAGVTVDDDSLIAITHRSGVRSRIVVSTNVAIPGPRFSVAGRRGTFVKFGVDPQEEALKSGRRPGKEPGSEPWGEEDSVAWGTLHDGTSAARVRTEAGAYGSFYAGVEEALVRGGPPPVDSHDAVRSLAVLEAALQSAANARVVEIPA